MDGNWSQSSYTSTTWQSSSAPRSSPVLARAKSEGQCCVSLGEVQSGPKPPRVLPTVRRTIACTVGRGRRGRRVLAGVIVLLIAVALLGAAATAARRMVRCQQLGGQYIAALNICH